MASDFDALARTNILGLQRLHFGSWQPVVNDLDSPDDERNRDLTPVNLDDRP